MHDQTTGVETTAMITEAALLRLDKVGIYHVRYPRHRETRYGIPIGYSILRSSPVATNSGRELEVRRLITSDSLNQRT